MAEDHGMIVSGIANSPTGCDASRRPNLILLMVG